MLMRQKTVLSFNYVRRTMSCSTVVSYYREVQKYSEHFLKFIVNQLPVVGFWILKICFASTQSELSKNTIGLEIWDHHGCRSASQSKKHRQKSAIFLESILLVFLEARETPGPRSRGRRAKRAAKCRRTR